MFGIIIIIVIEISNFAYYKMILRLLFRQLCALAALSVRKITEANTRICPIAEGNFIGQIQLL